KPAKQQKTKDDLCTSAQTSTLSQQNLTLSDWMHVYDFVDVHPTVTQAQIVQHFGTIEL
ncbi:hypothetical protein PAXRUDRAFT_768603, partial [Paxillus rubicundulus Ve08.2h10]